jgi:hypothetical protein
MNEMRKSSCYDIKTQSNAQLYHHLFFVDATLNCQAKTNFFMLSLVVWASRIFKHFMSTQYLVTKAILLNHVETNI